MKGILHIALVCLLAVFVSSCNKDMVEPHCPLSNDPSVNEGSAKSLIPPAPVPVEGTTSPGVAVARPGQGAVSEPTPTGISDDGDDISDSEKSRKKRR